MAKKKMVSKKLEEITSVFVGDIDDIINTLCDFKEKYENKYNYLKVLEGDDGWSDTPCLYLWGERYETDAEYRRRIEKERKQRNKKKEKAAEVARKEKEQLRKLIKKYPEEIEQ